MVRRAGGLKHILSRASAGIDQRRIAQFFPGREIDSASLALDVRPEVSARVRPFIPAQSKPAQVVHDRAAKFGPAPIAIQIFNPKNQSSPGLLSALLRPPKRHRMPKMQITGGRWGDAAAVGIFRFQIADFRLA
jgi:hypothetical protein